VSRTPIALLSLAVGGFAIGTGEFVTMGLLPDVASNLGVSIPTAGHLVSAYALGVVVGAPLLAVLTARLPRTQLLLALMSAFVLGNVASALAPSFGLLLLARFAAGLPHGAYFGIAAVVASSLVAPERRGRAIAGVMLGLTVANVAGVPISTFLGQLLGWRIAFWFVAVIGTLTVVLVWRFVPTVSSATASSPRQELGALRRPQVWLTAAIGAFGFGGMFAVYSYVAPILTESGGWSASSVPLALAGFGVGMTAGTVLGGRMADWSVPRSLVIGFVLTLLTLLAVPVAVPTGWGAAVVLVVLGVVSSITVQALQTRLMDVAGSAVSLGASLNHSALNIANAAGAFLGGVVIDRGYGWTSPALVGAGLAAIGLALTGVSLGLEVRERRAQVALPEVAVRQPVRG
jgi:DHA1 family inner membrane transport protein